jgi:hypothetical protein
LNTILMGNPEGKNHLEDQCLDGRTGSEWILGRLAWRVCIGFDWLRIGKSGGLFWVRWWTFGFLRNGISYLFTSHRRAYYLFSPGQPALVGGCTGDKLIYENAAVICRLTERTAWPIANLQL